MDNPDQSLTDRIAQAQLEKLQLENAKLRAEMGKRWSSRALAFTPLVSAIIAVSGFLFGIYQFQEQQRVRDATARLEQDLQLQNRLRSNVDGLLQFFADDAQTLASAAYHISDLKALTNIALSAEPPVMPGTRAVSKSFAQAVLDDCDLNKVRHAAFAATLVEEWPDYGVYLASEPRTLRVITGRYALAARILSAKAPGIFSEANYDRSHDVAILPDDNDERVLSAADRRHFALLFRGFRAHTRLFKDLSYKREQVGAFGDAIGNHVLAREALGIDINARRQ